MKKEIVLFTLALFPSAAASQDEVDLRIPTNRYIMGNAGIDRLVHWDSDISLSIHGNLSDTLRLYSVSRLVQYSDFANASLSNSSLVASLGFASAEETTPNYHIFMGDFKELNGLEKPLRVGGVSSGLVKAKLQGLDDLHSQFLVEQGPGCFVSWNFNTANAFENFLILIDEGIEEDAAQACLSVSVPLSFGVLPVVNKFNFTEGGGKPSGETPPFYNDSETAFVLYLSSYCRLVLEDFSLSCPESLMEIIFSYNADLLK